MKRTACVLATLVVCLLALAAGAQTPALTILNTSPRGELATLDPTLRPEFQTLALRAAAAAPGTVEWRVNGAVGGSAGADAALMWPLVRGRHQVAVRDAAGRVAASAITVK